MSTRTLFLCKPDAVERGLVGEIVGRVERKGLTILAMDQRTIDADLAGRHYEEHREKPFFQDLVSFITRGPLVAMVLEGGPDTWKTVRTLMGTTNPREAAPGTIRGVRRAGDRAVLPRPGLIAEIGVHRFREPDWEHSVVEAPHDLDGLAGSPPPEAVASTDRGHPRPRPPSMSAPWYSNVIGRDMAVDLGTANTVVYVRGQGVVLNEPSIVTVNTRTGDILAVGSEAKRMLGRTPSHIESIRPLKDGVIADFDICEKMLRYFIQRVHQRNRRASSGAPCRKLPSTPARASPSW
jgi:nucleoside diphosphate kinase